MDQFVGKYGPWALVLGASEGAGALFAEGLADRGLNVVLVSRRQNVIDDVAAGIRERTGVQTKTLAVDLSEPDAATASIVVNELRDRRILISASGPQENVLKIRPPLPFTADHATQLLSELDDVLAGVAQ